MSWSRRLALVLLVTARAASAQEEPAENPRTAREEAFRMVDAYVVSNLQESLGLNDEQFAKAIPLVKKLQHDRRDYLMERGRMVREMRRLLRQGGPVETQVLDLLKQVKTLDVEGPERTRRNLEALDGLLNPIQQAKYRVLEGEVEQRARGASGHAAEAPAAVTNPPRAS